MSAGAAVSAAPTAQTADYTNRDRHLERQLAGWLLGLLGSERPRRVAEMFGPGATKRQKNKKTGQWETVERGKYEDITGALTPAMLLAHARGGSTYAASLEYGRIGAADIERDTPAAGRAELLARYRDSRAAGLSTIAIYAENDVDPQRPHYGGHLFGFYAEPCDPEAIAVAWRGILPTVKEIWPCAQVIRLPFGYHRWAETRGELWYISDAGELLMFDLDSDLASALDLVTSLPMNAPPQASPTRDTPKPVTVAPVRRVSMGEKQAGRASLDDVKARFNAERTIADVLDQWGKATETISGWACLCGAGHTHATTLYLSKKGKLFSYSQRCHLYTKYGWDAFGLEVFLFHNNDALAAAKALNPIPAAPDLRDTRDDAERWASQHATDVGTDYVLFPAELHRRTADAQRKKGARQTRSQARMAQIAPLAAQLAASKACPFDRDLWTYHQRRWEERGAPEHVDSNERIARAVLGLDRAPTKTELRRLQLAHGRLIARGYLVRTVRSKKGEQHTNCWQPGDGYRVIRPAAETITLVDHESPSDTCLVACEGGGADPADLLERLSFASYLRNLAAELGEMLDLAELAALPLIDQEACEARLIAQLAGGDQAEAVAAAIADGACYMPALDWTAGGVLDLSTWRDPLELRPHAAGVDQAAEAQLLDLAMEPEPLVRCPPTEPNAAREYWALKHKKPVNFKQSRWIAYRLAELEIWRPVSEAPTVEPRRHAPAAAHTPQRPKRGAPSAERPQRAAGAQLQLELGPVGAGAAGFARALIEGSPPLTRSSGL